jgi:hypothetical protein
MTGCTVMVQVAAISPLQYPTAVPDLDAVFTGEGSRWTIDGCIETMPWESDCFTPATVCSRISFVDARTFSQV